MKCALQIQAGNAAFPPSGGSGALNISINRECAWTAKSDAPWVTLSAGEGQGAGSLSFKVASNADPAARNTGITVNDQTFRIAQEGRPCALTLSSTRETVEAAGGDRTVQVRASSAQCDWTASAHVPWMTIVSGREGRGDGAVRFRVDAGDGPPRAGTLSIAGQTVHVEQGTGCSYSIATDTFGLDASGGDGQVAVTAGAGCSWTAGSNTAWITITNGSTGNGPGAVHFRVATTNGPTRTGTLTVAGRTVTVVQSAGCQVSVNPATVNESASGGTATIDVDTAPGCTWSAATDAGWITLAGAAGGSGRGQVPIAVEANAGPARSGSVIIGGQRVAIAQASGCTYAVSPAGQQVAAGGGPAAASVFTVAGCNWRAASAVDWITLATPSGSGPGSVTFAAAPNQGSARAGTLTIAGHIHTVNQASRCAWSFVPPHHDMGAAGGQGNVLVFVTGPCTWTAASTVDWIRVIAGASGVGGAMVQFTVAPNSGSPRTGVVLIGGEEYQVNQAGR